ncbi:uncharacterized protein LOC118242555 [Electrophorus electricus]|uniref:uncharacterized protein LOC118242555 n=1 Tax=Electrophorus electricus TaxID=8005 RepID=UPI0015CFC1F0|nr:uncharacterized protein LOC118242555 [Electrophorus electricus]
MVDAKPSASLFKNECQTADHCVLTPCVKETCLAPSCIGGGDCILTPSEDSWCICVNNVSAASCGECSPATEHRDACVQTSKSSPLWIVALVLPVTFIVLILILCFVLKRQGKHGSHACRTPPTKQLGTDNVVFSLDHGDRSHQDISSESSKQPDLIVAGELLRRVENYNHSHRTGFRRSELEYYEIDSTYTTCCSNIELLQKDIDGHCNNSNNLPSWGKGKASQKVNTTGLESSDVRHYKSHLKRSVGCNVDRRCRDHRLHLLYKKKLPELAEDPRFLSEDEVKRLSSLLDQASCPSQACTGLPTNLPRAFSSARMAENSSESHSSFTCSEYECENELHLISAQDNRRGPETEDWSRGQLVLAIPSPFRDIETPSNTTSPGSIQQGRGLLNLGVGFNTYSDVFEDIANLTVIPDCDCNTHSDEEQII